MIIDGIPNWPKLIFDQFWTNFGACCPTFFLRQRSQVNDLFSSLQRSFAGAEMLRLWMALFSLNHWRSSSLGRQLILLGVNPKGLK